MGELNLDELERLAKAATPGPWEWWTSNSFLRLSGPDGRDGGVLYACNIRNEYATVVVSEADRRFIAEARTALPALIARIRELEQERDHYRMAAEAEARFADEARAKVRELEQALQGCVDAMLHNGVPVDPEHPERVALVAAQAAIDAARKEKGHG
ncbi:hypothetical protein N6G05_26580 [Cupriavidus gilardii]|uniref:hypothetical protein n=1 Tax=Cupriavidus gilardii TaxID=82541 RepID=UPI0021BF069A|nr:hypothetical protein [Cupriavidus gilardii]MCT9017121.1 hypothetical protein [Cupriavidus gilardii]MCT9056791.1 hypothetical protein [Cupriavidus gilardii]